MKINYKGEEFNIKVDSRDRFITKLVEWGDSTNLTECMPDFSTHAMKQYELFTRGKDFIMDDGVAELFDFMGYHDRGEFDLGYWKCKLQDDRVRNNLTGKKLHKITDRLSSTLVKCLRTIEKELPSDVYIAGGFLSSLFNLELTEQDCFELDTNDIGSIISYIDGYYHRSDIDLFMTKKQSIKRILSSFNSYSCEGPTFIKSRTAVTMETEEGKTIQVITLLYSSPAEIVYSFDVDSSCLVWVDGDLYATACGRYAVDNMKNTFNEDRCGPSYVVRLGKHQGKGFAVDIPQLKKEKINFDKLNALYVALCGYEEKLGDLVNLLLFSYYSSQFSLDACKPTSYYDGDIEEIDINLIDSVKITKNQSLFHFDPKQQPIPLSVLIREDIFGVYGEGRGEIAPYLHKDYYRVLRRSDGYTWTMIIDCGDSFIVKPGLIINFNKEDVKEFIKTREERVYLISFNNVKELEKELV